MVRQLLFGLAAILPLVGPGVSRAADDLFPVVAPGHCARNPWLIPFEEGRTELGAFARQRLDELATQWKSDGGPLVASGRVDGAERASLAQVRLSAVATALKARGIPSDALWLRDDGRLQSIVPNQPGVPQAQNRVVLIQLTHGGERCERDLRAAQFGWLRRNCHASAIPLNASACDDAMAAMQ